ncbi:MAG: hypothetical protein ABH885_08505 [Candidatus Omnitrophota bacterium]
MKMRKAAVILMLAAAVSPVYDATCASPSRLAQGTVTKYVIRGETTQEEVLTMLGGPNITTISRNGTEVWTYDSVAAVDTTEGGINPLAVLVGGGAGAGIGAIIGHQQREAGIGAIIGGITGAIAGMLAGWEPPVHESGAKTDTLMLWFDENKIVKDYSLISVKY